MRVPDEGLRAEAERDADDSRAGERGRDVDLEFLEDHQGGDQQDDDGRDVRQHAAQRPGPFRALERVEPGAEVDVVLEALDADRDRADEGKGERDDEQHAKPGAEGPGAQRPQMEADARVQPRGFEHREDENQEQQEERRQADQPQRGAEDPAAAREGAVEEPAHHRHRGAPGGARRDQRHECGGTTISATSRQCGSESTKISATSV
jgi:hypothetical protein